MSEKKELIEAYFHKSSGTLDKAESFTISAKAETVDQALDLFKELKKEMKIE